VATNVIERQPSSRNESSTEAYRAEHAAPSSPGIHPFSLWNRARSSRRQDPTNISSPLRAFAPSTMDYPLHATNVDVDVVAKCRRGLLRHPHKSAASSEAVSGSVANIHGGINRLLDDHSAAQAFRIGGRRVRPNEPKLGHGLILRDGWDVRSNHRRRPTLAASVRFDPLFVRRFKPQARIFSCSRSRLKAY
jgi:hypothetical protein